MLRFAISLAVLAALVLLAAPQQATGGVAITVNTPVIGGGINGLCGLDEAIDAANLGALEPDCDGQLSNTIEFNLGTDTPLINVTTDLPAITAFVVIDGNSGGADRVELRGNGNVGTGLSITNTADDTVISSLVINNFTGMGIDSSAPSLIVRNSFIGTDATGTMDMGNGIGIYLSGGSDQVIGGTSGTSANSCTGDCNLISGNQTGIYFSSSSDAVALGNFIGANVSGTAAIPNSTGVHNQGTRTLLGGAQAGAGNLISGNSGAGADMYFNPGTYQGNRIGTNAAGNGALPNATGILVSDVSNVTTALIGGTLAGAGNLISGNSGDGIDVRNTVGLFIQGNIIGRTENGPAPLGNGGDGIELTNSTEHLLIGGQTIASANTIAHSGGDGVRVDSAMGAVTGNHIAGNSIFSNTGKGIENINGGNDELPSPVINTAVQAAGATVSGTACPSCFIDVFSDDEDEGRVYHGLVVADGSGNWSIDTALDGPNVTATASDGFGNTSEFSAPFELPVATPTPTPTPTATPTPAGTETATPGPTPTPTQTPGPTPTGPTPTGVTPTPTPTPTPVPTPTGTAVPNPVQGDIQCDDDVDTVDALQLLRKTAGLSYFRRQGCPELGSAAIFGDVDCDGAFDAVDALKVLRFVAALPYTQTEPCTDIGDPL